MIEKIKNFWNSLSEDKKTHIISAWDTFISGFGTCFLIAVESGVSWTWAFWGGVIGIGLRGGIKALRQNYAPTTLGGIKKKL